jgi:ABC-type lipoprotein export system ATPase subunit
MILKLQHSFTHIIVGPSGCGKSTFVIKFLNNRQKLCDIKFNKIIWCHSENNAPYNLKGISFVEGIRDFEKPENKPMLIVLDDLMDSDCSKKVSELFTKGSYHRKISLIVITQNLFYQGPASRDVSLKSKYMSSRTREVSLQLCTLRVRFTPKMYIGLTKHSCRPARNRTVTCF